jgi:hypothetical protein
MNVSVVNDDPPLGDKLPPTILEKFRSECKTTKRQLMIRLVYVRWIADVDTLQQTFRAAFGIDMLWKATDTDIKNYEADIHTYTPGWVPNFEFPSAKEVTAERRNLVTGIPFKVVDGYNFMRTLITGTFMEQFELKSFPFDVQDLTVIMDMSFDLKGEVLLIPWSESWNLDPSVQPSGEKNFIQLNRSFSAIPDFEARRVLVEFSVRENCWGQMRMRIQMARRPQGMMGRIASLCCLLGVSTLSIFSMDPISSHADRLSFCITNILAFTAFCFIVSSQLPPTSYLTLLDAYTLSSFCLLVCILCSIAILGRVQFADEATRRAADDALFIASAVGVTFVQVYFGIRAIQLRRKELSKLTMAWKDLDAINEQPDDKPINVYGTGMLNECRVERQGDPAVSFEGMESKAGNFFR